MLIVSGDPKENLLPTTPLTERPVYEVGEDAKQVASEIAVGNRVGAVGTIVGINVGVKLGRAVGTIVGINDGGKLGIAVAINFGLEGPIQIDPIQSPSVTAP